MVMWAAGCGVEAVLPLSGESICFLGSVTFELGIDRFRDVHQGTCLLSQGWEGTCHLGKMPSSSL